MQINSTVDGVGNLVAVRLNTTVSYNLDAQHPLESRLAEANKLTNDVFFELVPFARTKFG